MRVVIRCNSESCRGDLAVPIVVSAPWPSIDSVCPVCGSGIMVVEEISQGVAKSVERNPAPRREKLWEFGIEAFGHPKEGEKELLSGYINRITPALIMLDTIHRLSEGIGKQHSVSCKDVAHEFMVSSDAIRRSLKELERDTGRGERLSDGFPSMDSKSDNPRLIVLRNLLGTDGNSLSPGAGYLMHSGAVAVHEDGESVYLTGRGGGLLALSLTARLFKTDVDEVSINWIAGPPKMPVFVTEEESRAILGFIRETTPDEYNWNMQILSMVVNAPGESWNSNNFADYSIEGCIEKKDFSFWNNRVGDSRLHRYLDRGITKGYGSERGFSELEGYVKDRMRAHINGTLSGALGRMKELGLIHPVRVGRNKNFRATEFGGEVLSDHRSP